MTVSTNIFNRVLFLHIGHRIHLLSKMATSVIAIASQATNNCVLQNFYIIASIFLQYSVLYISKRRISSLLWSAPIPAMA